MSRRFLELSLSVWSWTTTWPLWTWSDRLSRAYHYEARHRALVA
jgi:hypothetical protein